jgi:hypothetical protein
MRAGLGCGLPDAEGAKVTQKSQKDNRKPLKFFFASFATFASFCARQSAFDSAPKDDQPFKP